MSMQSMSMYVPDVNAPNVAPNVNVCGLMDVNSANVTPNMSMYIPDVNAADVPTSMHPMSMHALYVNANALNVNAAST